MRLAGEFHDQVRAAGARVLNDPSKVLRRCELLRLMRETGVNSFAAYRITGPRPALKFPVFLRQGNEHKGPLTPLLHDQAALDAALAEARSLPIDPDDLLIVEYCDTRGADGLFRKYAAMKIGDELIARHVLFSKDWVNKYPTRSDAATAREEAEFIRDHPHEGRLREIFAAAAIDYGRIDYGISNGEVVVWEINTNPAVMVLPGACAPERMEAQARSAAQIAEALGKLDCASPEKINVRFSSQARQALNWGMRKRVAHALRGVAKRAARWMRARLN
jgi:hypothetical protein